MSLHAALDLRRRCDYRGALAALADAATPEELSVRSQLHEDFGDYDAARADAERAGDPLRLAAVALAQRRPQEALELTNGVACVECGSALEELARLDDAEAVYRSLPNDDPRVRIGRGSVLRARAAYAEAERELLEALRLAEEQHGTRSIEAATALNALGMTYKYWGRFEEGRDAYERALTIVASAFGDAHPDAAAVHHNLGGLEHAARDFEAAESHATRSVELRRRLLGTEHVTTAEDEAALAPILHALGRDEEAETLLRHALPILERELGPEHPEVASGWHNLGAALSGEAAADAYRRALAAKERTLGPDHPSVALTLNNLAVAARRCGDLAEAERLYRRAVAILEHHVQPGHPNLEVARRNLASVVEERKKAHGAAV